MLVEEKYPKRPSDRRFLHMDPGGRIRGSYIYTAVRFLLKGCQAIIQPLEKTRFILLFDKPAEKILILAITQPLTQFVMELLRGCVLFDRADGVMGNIDNQALHPITAEAIRTDQHNSDQLGVPKQFQPIELNGLAIQHQVVRVLLDLHQDVINTRIITGLVNITLHSREIDRRVERILLTEHDPGFQDPFGHSFPQPQRRIDMRLILAPQVQLSTQCCKLFNGER
ncbi:hypothetical protein D3C75_869070 [compost metagenome]